MNQPKHTPRPWRMIHAEGVRRIFGAKGCKRMLMICEVQDSRNFFSDAIEDEANARLIVASPDLLAALEACKKYIGVYYDSAAGGPVVRVYDQAIAAIRKATEGGEK